MSPRYLLLLGSDARDSLPHHADLAARFGLTPSKIAPGITLLSNPACPVITAGDAGCILGTIFPRHGLARPVTQVESGEWESVAGTGGDRLLERFWGGYVAVVCDASGVRVLRDPSGLFPCYYASAGGLTLLASDAEMLAAGGTGGAIDVPEIGRQLYRAFVPTPGTALRGIRELLPGFSIRPSDSPAQMPCWSPWDHVADPGLETDQAAERLARAVQHCLHGWAAAHGRLLLSVSGGLDSSIIAACLKRAGADLVCLTMYADDPAGDERLFARALCAHLDLPLIERPYRLEDIDIAEPLAPHLPRPRDRTQANAYERTHLQVAGEVGATAFVTGNGGDHVFGYSQSAASVADRYLVEGVSPRTLQSLLDVCRQTGCSLFEAAAQAWRLAHRPAAHRVRPNPLLLASEFVGALGPAELEHPWLATPPRALPGKAAHISVILRAQPNLEAHRGAHWPFLTPLLSQPIVETCLAVPSWQWRAGGRDRALARLAFSGSLPDLILERRVKGTPGHFAARLLDRFRAPIRERLLGGRLAAHGVMDSVAVERLLRGDRPVPDLERVRILEMVNCEAWMEHWAGQGPGRSPRGLPPPGGDAPPPPSAGPIP